MSDSTFLTSAVLQFRYYKSLGDKTLERLNEEQLHWQPGEESTSAATIVKHLAGNMHSRWTDFLGTDGEKDFRDRESEFEVDDASKDVIRFRWESGWKVLFATFATLTDHDLERIVYIRAKGHSVTEAIHRQLCHYSYHVGQLVWIGKLLLGSDWESLSIPVGASQEFNANSFAKGQRREHFTEDENQE